MELELLGVDVYHLINWFYIYSFLGWLWETCYVSAKKGKLINRGFITGPLCTIYGFGALSVYLILRPVEDNLVVLFFAGIAVATTLEYVTAVLMESIFHMSWWDYSNKPFNFQGRICLGASLGWGCFTVLLFRVLHPFVSQLVDLYPVYVGEIASEMITVVYGIDFGFSAAAAFHLREKLAALETELEGARENLREKVSYVSQKLPVEEFYGRIEEHLEEIAALRELGDRGSELKKQFVSDYQARKQAFIQRQSKTVQRFMKAYPNLDRARRLRERIGKDNKK